MARFHVVMVDPADGEIVGHIVRAANASDAICNHPWLQTIYKDTWIDNTIWDEDVDACIKNIHLQLGWTTLCVNLDEAIMNELNGGDGNVLSAQTAQS